MGAWHKATCLSAARGLGSNALFTSVSSLFFKTRLLISHAHQHQSNSFVLGVTRLIKRNFTERR